MYPSVRTSERVHGHRLRSTTLRRPLAISSMLPLRLLVVSTRNQKQIREHRVSAAPEGKDRPGVVAGVSLAGLCLVQRKEGCTGRKATHQRFQLYTTAQIIGETRSEQRGLAEDSTLRPQASTSADRERGDTCSVCRQASAEHERNVPEKCACHPRDVTNSRRLFVLTLARIKRRRASDCPLLRHLGNGLIHQQNKQNKLLFGYAARGITLGRGVSSLQASTLPLF